MQPLSRTESQSLADKSKNAVLYLYIGHFLARWSARMWEFCVGLYMINIWPDSLLLTAAYGVADSASIVLFGPVVGRWVDKNPCVKVVKVWLLSQNLSFMIAGGAVIVLLVLEGKMPGKSVVTFFLLVILINVSGAVGVLSTLAGTILVEREWVVVIAEGQPPEVLTRMNSVIRRIDLLCKLFAPVVSGFIVSFVSLIASAMTLALWNVFSVCLQYWLPMSVYKGIPSLRERSQNKASRSTQKDSEMSPLNSDGKDCELNHDSCFRKVVKQISKVPYIHAWEVYLKQDVVFPGIALALLYFNVLSFGTLMTAALEWERTPVFIIGIARGISAVIGILATFLYPVLESQLSTVSAGLLSVWSQWSCLLICLASIWVPNKLASAYVLMSGVALSRLGLWMFDLSVVQQMQDKVAESDRCVVGDVQNSLQSVLNLTTYVMGIIMSNPQDFWKLIVISLVVVTHATALYSVHFYRLQKKYFRLDKLYQLVQTQPV